MASQVKSRWADEEKDAALEAKRKQEREEKKKAKAEKQRGVDAAAENARKQTEGQGNAVPSTDDRIADEKDDARPSKRRKISPEPDPGQLLPAKLLRFPAPEWGPCRHVDNFEKLNHIEEGSYGWVSRAREINTGEVVALKKLKVDNPIDGFPVTGLREIQTLKASRHENIVALREVVMGDNMNDVFLVMDFIEHDLRTLQEDMLEPFLPSEIKTLLLQLTGAVEYLHSNWIIHRDIKTSNLLMNNRGQIKVADFGMARYYGDPPPKLTQLVVTLWYRAPELLLGAEKYGPEIDLFSVGCIFGELLKKEPLLQGKNEVEQLTKIFELCGIPTEKSWPGFKRLPNAKSLRLPRSTASTGAVIRAKFPFQTAAGSQLLTSLLSLNPAERPTATEVLSHPYFKEDPKPKSTAMFPTFPSKAGQEKRKRLISPSAPKRGEAPPQIDGEVADFTGIFAGRDEEESGAGFQLKLI